MTLFPQRENDTERSSFLRRELPTGLRDGDGSAAGGSDFLGDNGWQLEVPYVRTQKQPHKHRGLISSRLIPGYGNFAAYESPVSADGIITM